MQACTIGLSIDEDIKLRSRKVEERTSICVRQVLSEPPTRSVTGAVTKGPYSLLTVVINKIKFYRVNRIYLNA